MSDANSLSELPTFIFLLLFVVYIIQLIIIAKRLRQHGPVKNDQGAPLSSADPPRPHNMMPILQLWPYLLLSLLGPTLISLVPDIFGSIIEYFVQRTTTQTLPEPSFLKSPAMFVGVRLMIAYLATVITLELALQAQSMQASKEYSWKGLLLGNLALDIISLMGLQFFKPIYDLVPSTMLPIVFALTALPTILTGIVVVSGTASELV